MTTQPALDGLPKQAEEVLNVRLIRSIPYLVAGIGRPVLDLSKGTPAVNQRMGSRKAVDPLVQRLLRLVERIRQITSEQGEIRSSVDRGAVKEGLHFGGEHKRVTVSVVVEGLDAEWIPRAEELLPPPVPEREGKVPEDPGRALLAPVFVGAQDELDVGVCTKPGALTCQRSSKLAPIVDSAIEGQYELPRLVLPGLCLVEGLRSRVKLPVTQAHRARHPLSRSIGPPVDEAVGHAREKLGVDRTTVEMINASDATHGTGLSLDGCD
jgi:hypothetical protein